MLRAIVSGSSRASPRAETDATAGMTQPCVEFLPNGDRCKARVIRGLRLAERPGTGARIQVRPSPISSSTTPATATWRT
jgi:hypothetical protein